MHDVTVDIARADLIAHAKANGYAVSVAQLERWHKADLIPRPHKRYKGKAKGTESRYPIIARDQVLALCAALEESRSFDRAMWSVWCAGFPLTELARPYLIKHADEILGAATAQLAQEKTRRSVIHRARYGPAPIELRPIRTALGNHGFQNFMRSALSLFAGQLDMSSDSLTPAIGILLFGLSAANSNTSLRAAVTTSDGTLPTGMIEVLRFCDFRTLRASLDSASDSELERARDDCGIAWSFVRRSVPNVPMAIAPYLYLLWFHFRFGYAPSRGFVENFVASPEWPRMREQFTTTMRDVQAKAFARAENPK
jgi:hypothetical protein